MTGLYIQTKKALNRAASMNGLDERHDLIFWYESAVQPTVNKVPKI